MKHWSPTEITCPSCGEKNLMMRTIDEKKYQFQCDTLPERTCYFSKAIRVETMESEKTDKEVQEIAKQRLKTELEN